MSRKSNLISGLSSLHIESSHQEQNHIFRSLRGNLRQRRSGIDPKFVGTILAVDRILDMCRSTVNVWSDSTATAVIARLEDADNQAA